MRFDISSKTATTTLVVAGMFAIALPAQAEPAVKNILLPLTSTIQGAAPISRDRHFSDDAVVVSGSGLRGECRQDPQVSGESATSVGTTLGTTVSTTQATATPLPCEMTSAPAGPALTATASAELTLPTAAESNLSTRPLLPATFPPASASDGRRSTSTGLRALLAAQTTLQTTDMFTTVYNLRRSDNVREANPLLAPFAGHPAALVLVGSAVNAMQVYTISKVYKRHPKTAVAWALALIGTEAYAVTNNLRVARTLRQTPR